MSIPYLELGEPPFDDPKAAAVLWASYVRRAGGHPSQETSTMFWRMIKSIPDVIHEYEVLSKSA